MFANQVSIKDLFSSNIGFSNGNRHDGSGDNDSSGQSNSQFPYSQSQMDFPDSQDMYGSQPSSQKDTGTHSPSKFYQRYMAKGPFHNSREAPQKPNTQAKPTFQQQLTANKARAKERDERDLLNGILNTVKDCSMEVKEVVTTLKEVIQTDTSANTEALTTCLKKVETTLSKNRAEFLTAVDTREESSEQIASLQEQLKERDMTIARLKEENVKADKENQAKLLGHLESLYHDHSDKLKHTLEQLYEGHQSELVRQGSVRDDLHQQLLQHQDSLINTNSLSLQSMENRIGEELSVSYKKMMQEGERTHSNWNKDLTHLQQQHLDHVNQLVQDQITDSINGHMQALKDMMMQNWQQLQTKITAHTDNRKAIEDDVQSRYNKEVQELRRRFQHEAKQIMDSPAPSAQDFSKTNDRYWRSNGADRSMSYPTQPTNNVIMPSNPGYMSSYNSSEHAAIPQPVCLSPAINVLEPIDFSANGLSAAKDSEPSLRNMFSSSNSITTFRSPISTITNSWTSKMLFSKPSPATVATVRPQLQSNPANEDTSVPVTAPSNNKKGVKRKPSKRGAKKKTQTDNDVEIQTETQEASTGYSLRKRNDVYEDQTQQESQPQVPVSKPRKARAISNTAQKTYHENFPCDQNSTRQTPGRRTSARNQFEQTMKPPQQGFSNNLNQTPVIMKNEDDRFEQVMKQVTVGKSRKARSTANNDQMKPSQQDFSYNVNSGRHTPARRTSTSDQFEKTLNQAPAMMSNKDSQFEQGMSQVCISKPRKVRSGANVAQMNPLQQDFSYNINSSRQPQARMKRTNDQFEQMMTQASMIGQENPKKSRSKANSDERKTPQQDFSYDVDPTCQTQTRRICAAEQFDQMLKQGNMIAQPRKPRNTNKANQRNTPKQNFSYDMNSADQTPVRIISQADRFDQMMQEGNVIRKAENDAMSASQAHRFEQRMNRGTVMTQIDNDESYTRRNDVFEFDSEAESPYISQNLGRFATTYERSHIYTQAEPMESDDEASLDDSSHMSSPSLSVAEVVIKRQVRKKQKTSPICASIICQQSCTSADNGAIYTTTTSKTVIENASYQVGLGD